MKYLICLLLLLSTSNVYADEFTRSIDLPPLSTTNETLINSINELFDHIKSINRGEIETKGYLKLGKDNIFTKLDLPIDLKDFSKFPQLSHEAYSCIYSYEGKISDVTITFSDRSRKIISVGTDRDFVVGVLNVGKEKFHPYEAKFTGLKMRVFLWLSSFIVFLVVSFIGLKTMKEKTYWPLYFFALVGLVVLQNLPNWELYFPGFLASVDERSFLEKNSGIISFTGLLMTLLIPLASFIYKKRNSSNQKDN